AKSRLSPPQVVFTAVELSGPEITLARIRPPAVHSILRKPTDVIEPIEEGLLRTHLAYSRRGQAKSKFLIPPVIGAGIYFYPIATTLAYSSRGKPKSHLQAPVVVNLAVEIYGPKIT